MIRAVLLALLLWVAPGLTGCADQPAQEDDHAHNPDGSHAEEDAHAHNPDGSHAEEDAAADGEHGHPHDAGSAWELTAWGESYEVFATAEPLVSGQATNINAHITQLDGYQPLTQGTVSVVLRRWGLNDQVFSQTIPTREGLFVVEVTPKQDGPYSLFVSAQAKGATEEILVGDVNAGVPGHPGVTQGDDHGAFETVSFLKEQQWRMLFATAAAARGAIHGTVRGTGFVKPAAGGEMLLTASIDGIVRNDPWPYAGRSFTKGATIFALNSRASQGRTLGELQALATEKDAELKVAQDRLTRLEDLFTSQAVSEAELEAARARTRTLRAQRDATARELSSARGKETRAGSSQVVRLTAPFDGEIAEVLVVPGQAVSSGEVLGRLVKVKPVWVTVHLAPQDAQRVSGGVSGIWLRPSGAAQPIKYSAADTRLVSISPEINAKTGRVTCILELSGNTGGVRLGSAVEAELLIAETREGVVVPAGAVLDDSGASIVYVQMGGEQFARRDVDVLGREGGSLLVRGLKPGERVVTEGGPAIRRAALVNAGVGHGHVH